MGIDILYQGILVSILTLLSYYLGHSVLAESGASGDHGVTMAFLTMSMAEIFHSLNMRSQRGSIFSIKSVNKTLLIAAIGSFLATTAVCEISFLANAFGFVSIGWKEYALAIALGICVIPVVEIVKLIQRKRLQSRKKEKKEER
jgi:Ca2+-transporting ATPase